MILLLVVTAAVILLALLGAAHLQSEAQAQAEARVLQQAMIQNRGGEFHVDISLDFPTTLKFPLALTVSDAAGVTGHFRVDRSGAVVEERPQ